MSGTNLTRLLGSTFEDDDVQRFLKDCGVSVSKRPTKKLGSSNAFLSNKKRGVDITFKDEADVEFRKHDYDDGDLVLVNVRMYGAGSNMGYEPFTGELPYGLTLEDGLPEVRTRLGKAPAWSDKSTSKSRWDFKDHCLFVSFDKQYKRIVSLSVQLPLP